MAGLVERLTGERILSGQKIREIVVNKAVAVSEQIRAELKVSNEKKMPIINTRVEIYNGKEKEILIFDDAILVKEQKQKRTKSVMKIAAREKEWVSTDVVVLEKTDGKFEYITELIDETGKEIISLEEVVKSKIKQEYASNKEALNIVAITDGAKAIRYSLLLIFATTITIILDWYHLEKRTKEFMSMIAQNKVDKEIHLDFILYNLWRGKVAEVNIYLETKVVAKNPVRLKELIQYLQKHQSEIIDYEQRKAFGKTIGSGRGEKAVDQVIGHRQKKKSMSWSTLGSKSLAILKTLELNNRWQHIWFPESFAS